MSDWQQEYDAAIADAAFQRGLAKGREEWLEISMRDNEYNMQIKDARIQELEKALRPLIEALERKTHPTWDQYNAALKALRAEPAGGGDQT